MSGKRYRVTMVSNLQAPLQRFNGELSEIEVAFASSELCDHVSAYSMRYSPHLDGCVVSLWDSWNRFLRDLVLESAAGPTVGIGGSRYVPTVARTSQQALIYIQQNKKALGVQVVKGEPNWYRVNDLATLSDGLGLANASQIIGAIGLTSIALGAAGTLPNPLQEIQQIRNFIAHKHPATLAEVQARLAGSGDSDLHSYLWGKTVGGVERFYVWLASLRIISEAACQ